jgi:hypothetical protein
MYGTVIENARAFERVLGGNVQAVRRGFADTGAAVSDEYRFRTVRPAISTL